MKKTFLELLKSLTKTFKLCLNHPVLAPVVDKRVYVEPNRYGFSVDASNLRSDAQVLGNDIYKTSTKANG